MAKAPKTKVSKTNYMNDKAFLDLQAALEDALEFERGRAKELHVTRIVFPKPPRP